MEIKNKKNILKKYFYFKIESFINLLKINLLENYLKYKITIYNIKFITRDRYICSINQLPEIII